jgi:hypothetical protein
MLRKDAFSSLYSNRQFKTGTVIQNSDLHLNNLYRNSSYLSVNTLLSITKAKRVALYEEVCSFYSENHGKHLNTPRGQNKWFLNVKNEVVPIITTESYKLNFCSCSRYAVQAAEMNIWCCTAGSDVRNICWGLDNIRTSRTAGEIQVPESHPPLPL